MGVGARQHQWQQVRHCVCTLSLRPRACAVSLCEAREKLSHRKSTACCLCCGQQATRLNVDEDKSARGKSGTADAGGSGL